MSTPVADPTAAPAPTRRERRLIHGLCEICYPRGATQAGQVVVAVCGDVNSFDRWANKSDAPADDCVVCVEILTEDLPARSCDHFGVSPW
ncbi:hypothetical protein [Actinophytocola sp.]|uniref:hypothetical protein n=1 Tax=Actinophytocola sp. TaxID=1872138 RepID=UPI002D7FA0BA|nr:hypothetical protein [Actinophytocola sp.]HET9144170.1 hypothetical protein [Actinophytocola sp.]